MMMLYAIGYLFLKGIGIWGINIPIGWGFAIVNFVWWIGIGHAGTLISAILLLLRQSWRNSINRFAEAMTLFAVACAGIFPLIHIGRPWLAYWLFPYPNTMSVLAAVPQPAHVGCFRCLDLLHRLGCCSGSSDLFPTSRPCVTAPKTDVSKMIYGMLSMGWRGSARHWQRYEIDVPAVGRTRDAARALGAHGCQLRFRRRHRSRAGIPRSSRPTSSRARSTPASPWC